jgi:hypothetical protein
LRLSCGATARGFLCGIENLPVFDLLTEHATKSARTIRNLDHDVGDHRDRCPCPDHDCRRLVRDLIEQIAGVSDYLLVALETYKGAVKRWPGAKITLRNRARVIEQSWRD